MNSIAEIRQFNLFTQSVHQFATDRDALKKLKNILLDKKTEIELKLDSPFYQADEEKKTAMEGARGHIIRKMNHVDSLLSITKGAAGTGGYLMWVIAREGGTILRDGWLATTKHPANWLVENLPEEADPDDLELSHFMTLNPEQYENLDKRIERV
jgi:hypothetical protein